MPEQRVNGHTVSRLTVHIVWSTKYRYPVLHGDVQKECRNLLIQISDAEGINILKGVVSKDHVHMQYAYRVSSIPEYKYNCKEIEGKELKKITREIP